MQKDRFLRILDELDKTGSVEVKRLSAELKVTEKTIRHDLIDLEEQGLLKRVHGGAVQNQGRAGVTYSDTLRTICLRDKECIAKAAYDYLIGKDISTKVLYLDAGTTTYELAQLLKTVPRLKIITNDLMIASTLSSIWGLYVTGGTYRYQVNRYLVGPDAVNMLNNHWISIAIVGTAAVNLENGFMTLTNEDAEIKKTAISRAEMTICVADHTKFGKNSFAKFADFEDVDMIITDDETSEDILKAVEEKGVSVITAHKNSL